MVGVRSVPPHKAQATNTSLQQIQTNDVRNYPHCHRTSTNLTSTYLPPTNTESVTAAHF